MDENRTSGTARNVAGKVEEGLGRAAGDASNEFKGKLDEAAGAAQDLYGQTADAARQTAVTFDKWLRNPSKRSLTPASLSLLALAGSWEGCIDRSNPTCSPRSFVRAMGARTAPTRFCRLLRARFQKATQLHSSGS
jgi:uncharacterized protein YjbJ (UPF0337 family)